MLQRKKNNNLHTQKNYTKLQKKMVKLKIREQQNGKVITNNTLDNNFLLNAAIFHQIGVLRIEF